MSHHMMLSIVHVGISCTVILHLIQCFVIDSNYSCIKRKFVLTIFGKVTINSFTIAISIVVMECDVRIMVNVEGEMISYCRYMAPPLPASN